MTDLVTRLRTRGCWLCNGDCAAANPPVTYCPVKEDNEAADEIERLREANKWLDGARLNIWPELRERAERAEAELREAKELIQYLSLFEGGDARLAVKAERDAYRDAATARDRNEDALRALLAEAREATYSSDPEVWTNYLARIDAALREEKTGRG